MDCLEQPLSVERLSGVEKAESDEDVIIGHMKDKDGNSGFMIVNYNDSTYEKRASIQLTFKDFTQALVYRGGKKQTVDLKNHRLTVDLDVGEGVFVIPCG